ncbi:MAG TPA: choice-of-anchor tandem repeat GloVer-containing protein [Cyclobacteriaceae bacterium]|nr:choice-of-anchor tandem repeat GloVer-containing protein [Cyclobacteriaceae bacterium]
MLLRTIFIVAAFFCIAVPASSQAFYGVAPNGGTAGGGTIFRANLDGGGLRADFNFPIDANAGSNGDASAMVVATSGKMYGVLSRGGVFSEGVLFEYDPSTNIYTKKIDFRNSTGQQPIGGLVFGPNGNLYGTCEQGGQFGEGSLFEYAIATNTITYRANFQATVTGSEIYAGLALASNNKFYGVTAKGGANNDGVLYEFDPGTNALSVKHNFSSVTTGRMPYRALKLFTDGKLYGMTPEGGINNKGVIFEFDPVAGSVTKRFDFGAANGENPYSTFSIANGKLYATTTLGGAVGYGVLFEYVPPNTFTKKQDLTSTNGTGRVNLMTLVSGKLYTTFEQGGPSFSGTLFEYDPTLNNYIKRVDFDQATTGSQPRSGLTLATNGKLYGTTTSGGSSGYGTIFEYTLGASAVSKKIDLNVALNGSSPRYMTLAQTSDGKLYGTAVSGGSKGKGVLFQYDPATKIYTRKIDFDNVVTKGANPQSNPVLHSNGKLYGVTADGGTNTGGTLYEYDPATSILTTRAEFDYNLHGAGPVGSLFLASNGKFYGIMVVGGATGVGTIYEFNPTNNTFAKKVDFNQANGAYPIGSFIEVSGKLYGLAQNGGTSGLGTLFEYDMATTITVKANFIKATTGAAPQGTLFRASDTKLYGVTSSGGNNDFGMLFSYDIPNNNLVGLASFTAAVGAYPNSSLIQANGNKLYGTTYAGGAGGYGALFEFNMTTSSLARMSDFAETTGLNPSSGSLTIVNNLPLKVAAIAPQNGAAGSTITISVENFNPALAHTVYIGGIKATVTGSTYSQITAIVPGGASMGPVSVTCNGLTAYSKDPFFLTFPFKNWIPGSFPARFDLVGGTANNAKVTVADFNNDGLPDAALADGAASAVHVFRNTTSAGTMSFASKQTFTANGSVYSLVAADFDADGKLDLAGATYNNGSVSILRNISTPANIAFAAKFDLPGSQQSALAVGDIDNDGKPDIVVVGNTNQINVFKNTSTTGNLSFAAPVSFSSGSVSTWIWAVELVDIDNDGRLDIAAPVPESVVAQSRVIVLRNTSTNGVINSSSFATAVSFAAPGYRSGIAFADLDGDGKTDMISSATGVGNRLMIWRNKASSNVIDANTFETPVIFDFPDAWSVTVGNVDGDNKPDIVAQTISDAGLVVLKNAASPGSITTSSFSRYAIVVGKTVAGVTQGRPLNSIVADMNNDGLADIVFGDEALQTCTIMLNTNVSPPPVITSFEPAFGTPGATITITGSNFGANAADNIVRFGPVKATVSSVTAATVTVLVPTGAAFKPITVTANGLTGSSLKSFQPAFASGSTFGTSSFAAKVDITAGTQPQIFAPADINGDGKIEIAVANIISGNISVLSNASVPGTVSMSKFDYSTDLQPYGLATGDIDNDGKLDVATANLDGNNISVFRNQGTSVVATGSLARFDIPTDAKPFSIAMADVDVDGKTDLVVTYVNGTKISIFHNSGLAANVSASSFYRVDVTTLSSPSHVSVADLNGDNKPELIVTSFVDGSSKINVFKNNCDVGSSMVGFGAATEVITGLKPYSTTIADFNADGKPDIAVTNNGTNTISVIMNNIDATGAISAAAFGAPVDFTVGSGPNLITSADIDGDRKPDIITISNGLTSASINVLRNLMAPLDAITTASFQAKVDFPVGDSPINVGVADIDGDGKPDLLASTASASLVSILRNTATFAAPTASAQNIAKTSFNIAWTASPGATGYKVDVSTDNFATFKPGYDGLAATVSPQLVSGMPEGTGFVVRVRAVNATGESPNSNVVAVTTLAADSSAPIITVTSVTTVEINTAYSLIATIKDDESGITGTPKVAWRSLSGTAASADVNMTAGAAGSYSKDFTAAEIGELGIEFTITAVSTGGTTTTPYVVRVKVVSSGLTIPYSAYGTAENNYRIIAVPLTLTTNTVLATLGDDLEPMTRKTWRISHYADGIATDLTSSSAILPKLGYWFIAKTSMGAIDTGPGEMVAASSTAPATIALKTGWNQIGNPYYYNVKWSDVVAANPNLTSTLRGYEGTWGDAPTLEKMKGAFIKVTANIDINIPLAKNASVNGGRTYEVVPENILAQENWDLKLMAMSGIQTNLISGIGMHKDAREGYDMYDGFTMPRFFENYLEVNHRKSDHGDFYSMDIVPTSQYHVWEFDVESNSDVALTKFQWDNSNFGENEKTLILWDVARMVAIDMRKTNVYEFNRSESNSFKVYFGDKDGLAKDIGVDRLVFHSVSPNPTEGPVEVAFSIPEDGNVQFQVVDLLGRIHWTGESHFTRGYHEAVLTKEFDTAKGLYIVQIKYGTSNLQKRIVVR